MLLLLPIVANRKNAGTSCLLGRPGRSLSPLKAWNLEEWKRRWTKWRILTWTKSVFYFVHTWGGNQSFGNKDEWSTNKCGKMYSWLHTRDCDYKKKHKKHKKIKHLCCVRMQNSLERNFQLTTNRNLCTAARFPQKKFREEPSLIFSWGERAAVHRLD